MRGEGRGGEGRGWCVCVRKGEERRGEKRRGEEMGGEGRGGEEGSIKIKNLRWDIY